ncbi:MAG: hypothetical protein ACFB6S_18615 [Geminicoccaceae bacterium]
MGETIVEGWQVTASPKTGNPLYVQPSVLVLYRQDHAFVLDSLIPRPDRVPGGYDLVLASQPFRARTPAAAKARNVLVPLARSLDRGGRMVVIQSCGDDPGLEIIREIWPDEEPFVADREQLAQAMREAMEGDQRGLIFTTGSDEQAIFRFHLHTLPSELGDSIGTSTLLAAWNAATYVAQIEDQRYTAAISTPAYLEATRKVLNRHGGLWFNDESFVVSRSRR